MDDILITDFIENVEEFDSVPELDSGNESDLVNEIKGENENDELQSEPSNIVLSSNDISNDNNNQVSGLNLPITVSGDTISNYYIYTVSDNSLSNNIMNKPLNEYTVSESLGVFIFLELLIGGFIFVIRKEFLKWH